MPKNSININKNVNNEPLMFKLKKKKNIINSNNNSYRNINMNIINNIYKFNNNNIIYNCNNEYNNSIKSNQNLKANKKDEKKKVKKDCEINKIIDNCINEIKKLRKKRNIVVKDFKNYIFVIGVEMMVNKKDKQAKEFIKKKETETIKGN